MHREPAQGFWGAGGDKSLCRAGVWDELEER